MTKTVCGALVCFLLGITGVACGSAEPTDSEGEVDTHEEAVVGGVVGADEAVEVVEGEDCYFADQRYSPGSRLTIGGVCKECRDGEWQLVSTGPCPDDGSL